MKVPSYDWEIINSFLNSSNAAPSWVNCNLTWGRFDENTTAWTGAVGQVRNCQTKKRVMYFL